MDIGVDSKFFFGLYVYFRVLALSLHRADANFKEQMVEHCEREDLPSPQKIISAMETVVEKSKPWRLKRYFTLISAVFGRMPHVIWFPENKWRLAQSSLRQLVYLVTEKGDPPLLTETGEPPARWQVRYALSKAGSSFILYFPRKKLDEALFVNHLNHNIFLSVKKFDEIVYRDWLQSIMKTEKKGL